MSYFYEERLIVILVLIFNVIYTLYLFSFVGLREILDEEMHERCPSG